MFFILLAALVASTPASSPSAPPLDRATRPGAPAAVIAPEELFSRRALRRARLLIQMRVMQLRDERLECVREALRHELPNALWPELPTPSRGSADTAADAARCADLMRF